MDVVYNDKQHAVQTFLDIIRALDADYDIDKLPKLMFSSKDTQHVSSFLKRNKIKNFVCIAPGAAESAKCRMWPAEDYAALADEISSKYSMKMIFIGSLNESSLVQGIIDKMENKDSAVNSAGKMTLTELFCLIGKAKLFVGNDSGPMHIAAAQGTKTIGLFGPNLPLRFGPFGKGNTGIYRGSNCEFSPCINVHLGQVPDCLYPRDGNDYQKCMKNISVDDVMEEVERMMK